MEQVICGSPSHNICISVRHGMFFQPRQHMNVKRRRPIFPLYFTVMAKKSSYECNDHQVNQRRSANYHPTIWDFNLVDSFSTPYSYEFYGPMLEELKEEAKMLFKSTKELSIQLKLIDSIQRLGIAYHFEEEIRDCMSSLAHGDFTADLYTTALMFRLLRQHGYSTASDVFDKFKDRDGRFIDSLSNDVGGLLNLHEASHLGIQGEYDLEESRSFSTKHLKSPTGKLLGTKLGEQVQHSLEMPLHWRMPRLEAFNFINVFSMEESKSSNLLELAKLDYNLVQSVYQKEVKELVKWWRDLDLRKLTFSRDRLMENYLWAMGIVSEPQFSKCRKGLTKFVCILTVIDDIYDVYGSKDELETFTDAVNRWSIEAMKDLPEYMKICYLAMFNFGNELAYDGLKDHGFDTLPYIREAWANLCESYLVEARWFNGSYTPTLDEYLGNGWRSVGGPAAMVHAWLLLGLPITNHYMDSFRLGSEIIYWSSLITRLNDDLGTSQAEIIRGDVAKSIQCYMREKGVSEEQARDHIKSLISFSWKKLNQASMGNSVPKDLVKLSLNMARTAHSIFEHGDGIGTSTGATKHRLMSLIVTPFRIEGLKSEDASLYL